MNVLRQQIAQMLCFGFSGNDFEDNDELQAILASPDGIGALILFDYDCHTKTQGKNILSLTQVQKLNYDIKSFYASRHTDNQRIWLAIDLEGGRVDRLKNCAQYPVLASPYKMTTYPRETRLKLWQENACLIKKLGFDINFAPVVDLNLSPNEGIFGPLERCFSDNPRQVADFALEFLNIYRQEGVMGCLKHYPGHGSAKNDSHHGFVDVTDTFNAISTFNSDDHDRPCD
jgi:beta-N-acetylhexosaminidase